MLQQEGIRAGSISLEAQKIGGLFEDFVEDTYLKNLQYAKEVPFRSQIGDATVSGRIDFITEGPKAIHECKATFSSSTAREAIELGQVKFNHLAQMSAYFVETKTTEAYLYVGRYQASDDGLVCVKHRKFKVAILNDGTITVDGVPTMYTINGYLNWVTTVTKNIQEKRIDTARPVNPTQGWSNPCRYCPYRSVCDSVDNGSIVEYDEFVSQCASLAKTVVVKPAKITKVRKGKA
jgi:hypothetical protein